MIRFGIIGLGSIANRFARTVNDMNSGIVRLTAAASRSEGKAKAFAEKYGAQHYYGSYEELCADDTTDAVYICTPNNLHYENCMTALSHGKHVLCEKPFTTDASQAEELYRYAREKGLFIMEGLWICQLPLLIKAAEMIRSGAIGKVGYIRAEYGFTAEGERLKRKLVSELGGGALLDIGIYNIGFVKMMYGSDPIEIKTDVSLNGYGTDSLGTILAKYPGGGTASMTAAIGMKMKTEGMIYGSLGTIRFPDYQKAERMEVTYYDGRSEEYHIPFRSTGFEYEIEDFCSCVEGKKAESPFYTHAQSIEVMRTLDRAREKWGMRFCFEEAKA